MFLDVEISCTVKRIFVGLPFIAIIFIIVGFTREKLFSFNHVFISSNENATNQLKPEIAAHISDYQYHHVKQNSSIVNTRSYNKTYPSDFDHKLHLQKLKSNSKYISKSQSIISHGLSNTSKIPKEKQIQRLQKIPSRIKLHMFHNVCLEASSDNPLERIITIYNAEKNIKLKVDVTTGPNARFHRRWVWPITFKKSNLTQGHTLITNHSAFFVITTCEGNLYHFWLDSTIGLYAAMKATNRLNSSIPNQLFYYEDVWKLDRSTGCHNPARYEQFIFALSIKKEHISYHMSPVNICYYNATFGYDIKSVTSTDVKRYIYKKFRINLQKCKYPTITIQQRKLRRIMNAEVLKQEAIKFGWTNTDVVTFEDLSIEDQLKTIACTDVLVGIQGAGLEWLYFMRPNTSLLELAWPDKGWYYYYQEKATNEGIKAQTLQATNISLNLDAYVAKVRYGKPLSNKERGRLQTAKAKSSFDNHWKWADATFNPKEFVRKLQIFLSARNVPIGHN